MWFQILSRWISAGEIAIETALSGNIQNIVTEDEATAKDDWLFEDQSFWTSYVFTSYKCACKQKYKNEAALGEKGVLGIANKLVKCDPKFDEVVAYLLGRVIVVDTIDNAIALAKKNHYSLHIVTVEGEYLAPGGSMSGGAFKIHPICLRETVRLRSLKRKLIRQR